MSLICIRRWLIPVACFLIGIGNGSTAFAQLSKEEHAKFQARRLVDAVEAYYIMHGKYPNSLEDLITNKPKIIADRKNLLDPWGKSFRYDPTQNPPRIWSEGGGVVSLADAILLVEKAGKGEVIRAEKKGKGKDAKFFIVLIAERGERQGYRVNSDGKIFGPFAVVNDGTFDDPKPKPSKTIHPSVTADDIHNAFEARYGPKIQCRMIVMRDTDRAKWADIRKEVAASDTAFRKYAREQFIDSLKVMDGKAPPIHKHFSDANIERAAFGLKKGEVSEVIELPDRTAVILKCDDHIPAQRNVQLDERLRQLLFNELMQGKTNKKIPEYLQPRPFDFKDDEPIEPRPEEPPPLRMPGADEDEVPSIPLSPDLKERNGTELKPCPAQLKLMVKGPSSAHIGHIVSFSVAVSNRGSEPVENVVLTADISAGLEHDSKFQVLNIKIPHLAAGKTHEEPLVLTTLKAGTQRVRITATGNNLSDQRDVFVTIIASKIDAPPAR